MSDKEGSALVPRPQVEVALSLPAPDVIPLVRCVDPAPVITTRATSRNFVERASKYEVSASREERMPEFAPALFTPPSVPPLVNGGDTGLCGTYWASTESLGRRRRKVPNGVQSFMAQKATKRKRESLENSKSIKETKRRRKSLEGRVDCRRNIETGKLKKVNKIQIKKVTEKVFMPVQLTHNEALQAAEAMQTKFNSTERAKGQTKGIRRKSSSAQISRDQEVISDQIDAGAKEFQSSVGAKEVSPAAVPIRKRSKGIEGPSPASKEKKTKKGGRRSVLAKTWNKKDIDIGELKKHQHQKRPNAKEVLDKPEEVPLEKLTPSTAAVDPVAAKSSLDCKAAAITKSEVVVECVCRYDGLKWLNIGKERKGITPDAVQYAVAVKPPSHLVSLLRIKGHSSKGMSCTFKNTLIILVMEGEISVVLHTTQFPVKKGDSFFVPPKNNYDLINEREQIAELFIIQYQHDGPLDAADTPSENTARLV